MSSDSFQQFTCNKSVKSLLCVLMQSSSLDVLRGLEAAEWAPAKGPLMTRWAKDVSPDNVHPEYPRPQMVRADWLNLNRLWQLEMGKADDVCVSR